MPANASDTARALVQQLYDVAYDEGINYSRRPHDPNPHQVTGRAARAALLAYVAGVEQQLATLEAWLRDGHDENLSDRWICTPNGSEGPVVARGYEFKDIERPKLAMLADALAARPTEARDS